MLFSVVCLLLMKKWRDNCVWNRRRQHWFDRHLRPWWYTMHTYYYMHMYILYVMWTAHWVAYYVGQWITLSWNFGSYMPNYLLNINIQWSLFSCPIVFISFFILLWMPLQWASKAINKKKTTTYYHQWPDFPCEVSNIVGSICRW